MNFHSNGWFAKYIQFRRNNPFGAFLPSHGAKVLEDEAIHNEIDQEIYYFLQPTGLLYGSPIRIPFPELRFPKMEYFDSIDRLLLTQLDCLFAVLVADREYELAGLVDHEDRLEESVKIVKAFYTHYPPAFEPPKSLAQCLMAPFTPAPTPEQRFEAQFFQRASDGKDLNPQAIFFNNFLFLDIYGCLNLQRRVLMGEELTPALVGQVYEELLAEREALLQLIIAIAYSNQRLDPEEERLISGFIESAQLGEEKSRRLKECMYSGVKLDQVVIPKVSWLVRRYFLEVVLLIALLDKVISKEEEKQLHKIVERLGLWKEELSQSRLALEGFLSIQGNDLQFYNKKPNLTNIRHRIKEKAGIAVRKNMSRIVQEIKETKELSYLLVKSTKQPLTPLEKQKVADQLADILKTIPALAIFALPGGGLILPVVMKLLPFNLLPSSFDEEK